VSHAPVFLGLVQDGRLHLDFKAQYDAYIKRFEGDEVEVEVRKRRTKRSLRQNAAMWVLLGAWARAEGHNVNDLKDDVMGEAFGWSETPSPITGRVVPKRARTSELDVSDFCHLIETILETAAGCGVVLQAPDEYRKAKESESKRLARKAG
jgi:hypothetical protein